jgi:CheY-like chemotaxis protein
MPTEQILNADEALRCASTFTSADFLFIDVMLAVAADETKSQFARTETDDYKLTGLKLVEKLRAKNPALQVKHMILMSQSASKKLKDRIRQFADDSGIRYIQKSAYDDPVSFGDDVMTIVQAGS